MLLFCGIPSEPPLQLAREAAEAANADYVVFNQREAQYAELSIDVDQGNVSGVLRIKETNYPLQEFTGVYTRIMDWNTLPENAPSAHHKPDFARIEHSHAIHAALNTWIEMADCRVLNKNSAMASNVSKPYQAQLIRQCGFSIPPTLVTNEPTQLSAFVAEHGRVIYKSTSSMRSIVQELSQCDQKNLHKLRDLPTQFQQFISGTNIRVHVVGAEVFATQIESDAVDYRYTSQDEEIAVRAIDLDPEIERRCLQLSRQMDLPLCGIDLKVSLTDEVYCFEVNPSPAYNSYQEQTGQPISGAIVRYLTGQSP